MIRLGSVTEYGFGPNTGAISLIYSYLLKNEFGINKNIFINHIGNDLQEVIIKQRNEISINIRYELPANFSSLDDTAKNVIFLNIIHLALNEISKEHINVKEITLEGIKKKLLDSNFLIDLIFSSYIHLNGKYLLKVIVCPTVKQFNFYISLEKNKQEICRRLIYQGKPSDYYIEDLFGKGKWMGEKKFILKGIRSEIEFHINIDNFQIDLVNISAIKDQAPIFNMFRIDSGAKELKDYINSLNPAIAVSITQSKN